MLKSYLFVLLCFIATSLSAQVSVQIKFNTGNVELDADLNEINVRARADFGSFKAELGLAYHVSEEKIDHLHSDLQMEPADIYVALELSSISGRPVDEVVKGYRSDRPRDWGRIAKRNGIRPDSPEFHKFRERAKVRSEHERDHMRDDKPRPRRDEDNDRPEREPRHDD